MTLAAPAPTARSCSTCGATFPPSLLACPTCGKLAFSAELKLLAREGDIAERAGKTQQSLVAWRKALELLPPNSTQHAQVLAKVSALSALAPGSASATEATLAPQGATTRGRWAKWLASFGAAGLLLFKFKAVPLFLLGKGKLLLVGLTQAKTFFSMAITVGVYTLAFGWWFALGLVVSIYVHEMGHVASLRRYGIAATAPMFIPGIGAFIRLKQHPATPAEDARVGLAGPIWGTGAAVVALALGHTFDLPILVAIGRVGAWINLFNLLPVWQLDGGRAFSALSRRQRAIAAGGLFVLALFAGDGLLFILAIAAAVRAWIRSATTPSVGDRAVLVTYLGVAAALVALMAGGGPIASPVAPPGP